jgi:SAM-dependent methyltransferase
VKTSDGDVSRPPNGHLSAVSPDNVRRAGHTRGVKDRARRGTFDEVADLYDHARPAYPPELIADLVELTGVGVGTRVLEIGCGTGQLTVPLAQRGAAVTAVELGPRLAEIARRKTAPYDVEVVVADFDEWPLPPAPFDLVVAATSFRWLDPATRAAKCAAACAEGGALAVIETYFGWGARDRFSVESEACYARWVPDHRAQDSTLAGLPDRHPDLEGARFARATGKRYVAAREYGASRYGELVRTFSDVRALDEPHREGLLSCLTELIHARFDGRIFRHDVYELWLAR